MTKAPFKTVSIDSFGDYVNRIKEFDLDGTAIILFRGQCADHPLIPKIGRLRFRNSNGISENEKRILDQFKRLSIPHLAVTPKNNWEWLSVAQHHGLPTRLLDWSINPLAALWFAVQSVPERDKIGNQVNGVVWMFSPNEDDLVSGEKIDDVAYTPFSIPKTLLFEPPIVAQRINAQQGWFSVHKFDSKKKVFTPFEKNRNYRDRLVKFQITAKNFPIIRNDLDRFGINRATLFPDLDGLTHHIQWLKSYMSDEK